MTTRAQMSASAKNAEGHTDLMCAALEGRTETVKALLCRGADVNAKDNEGHTALMFAVINLHKDTMKALLEHRANVNAGANDGATALILAVCTGDIGIVQALLDEGADVKTEFTFTGKTALTLATEKGYANIAQLLNRAGAKK